MVTRTGYTTGEGLMCGKINDQTILSWLEEIGVALCCLGAPV